MSQRIDVVVLNWKQQLVKTIMKNTANKHLLFNYVLDFARGLKIHLFQIATKISGHTYSKFTIICKQILSVSV